MRKHFDASLLRTGCASKIRASYRVELGSKFLAMQKDVVSSRCERLYGEGLHNASSGRP